MFGVSGDTTIFHQLENALAKSATISKAGITTNTGITAYNLQPTALGLTPDDTPLLDLIPRQISHRGDTMTHWKAIRSFNTNLFNLGVSEGQRSASITPLVEQKSRAYATLGLEANYTFEAEEASEGFDNVPDKASAMLLADFRLEESRILGYGNATYPLGIAPTPVATVGTAPGSLPAAAYFVRVVALTFQGLRLATVATGVLTTYIRNNNDGSQSLLAGGSSIASASGNVTLAAAGSVNASVPAVRNAYGYAWYIGSSAATAALAAITPVNFVTITAPPVGTQLAAAVTTDNTADPLIFDGLASQFMDPTSNAYFRSMDGGLLTPDGAGGIQQFSDGFAFLYDNNKVSIDTLVVGGRVKLAINKAVLASNGPVYRIDAASGTQGMTAGNDVGYILNPITGNKVKIVVDPWAPANFAFGFCSRLPYRTQDVPMPFWLETRMRDYYQINWPITTRNNFKGVYYSGVLKVPAYFAGAVFPNIGN